MMMEAMRRSMADESSSTQANTAPPSQTQPPSREDEDEILNQVLQESLSATTGAPPAPPHPEPREENERDDPTENLPLSALHLSAAGTGENGESRSTGSATSFPVSIPSGSSTSLEEGAGHEDGDQESTRRSPSSS
jgi:hypothetical protein